MSEKQERGIHAGRKSWKRVVAGTAAIVALLAAPVPAGAESRDKPAVTQEQRAAALARPGLVYVETEWEYYVVTDHGLRLNDYEEEKGEPYRETSQCSGFVVNPNGHVVTATHCVVPDDLGQDVVEEWAEALWELGYPAGVSRREALERARANWAVQGETKGSDPARKVTVQYGVARANLKDTETKEAKVEAFKPTADGDVALLKVAQSNLPTLEIAPPKARIDVGTPVLAIGYPGSVEDVTDADAGVEPTSKAGSVSSRKTSGGIPVIDVSAPFTLGMSGGAMVNFEGQVIGVISFKPSTDNEGINFAIDASVLRDLLTQNNVSNALGPFDITYRKGLAAFYAGDYSAAIDSFSRVLATVPWHAQAQALKQQASELQAEKAASGGGGVPLTVIAGGAIIVLLLGALVLVRRRGRTGVRGAVFEDVAIDGDGEGEAESLDSPPASPVYDSGDPSSERRSGNSPGGSSDDRVSRLEPLKGSRPLAAVSPPRFCENCGSPQDPRARFCPACGTRVEKTA